MVIIVIRVQKIDNAINTLCVKNYLIFKYYQFKNAILNIRINIVTFVNTYLLIEIQKQFFLY